VIDRDCEQKVPAGRFRIATTDLRPFALAPRPETGSLPWNVEALLTGLVTVRVGQSGKILAEFRIDSAVAAGPGRRTTRQELEHLWEEAIGRLPADRGHQCPQS
jgi:hypothetical protein